MTESGELDGCYFSSSYLAARVPELALFDQHFAVPTGARPTACLTDLWAGTLQLRSAQDRVLRARVLGQRVASYFLPRNTDPEPGDCAA